ncbi:unnamed protein product [Closterium sp. NIES-54]
MERRAGEAKEDWIQGNYGGGQLTPQRRELAESRVTILAEELPRQESPKAHRWTTAGLPKFEVAERFTGIPGEGPSLKNYMMQLEIVKYCRERDGMDPGEFFRRMVVTLAGKAETYYRMVRED